MSSAADITPLIITFNEEPNIDRVLGRLTWARRVIVLDSGSTDRTREICEGYPNVLLLTRPFDSLSAQCNHGLQHVDTEWCLSIDADYVVPEATVSEMVEAVQRNEVDGFDARLAYCVGGRVLRRAILPNRVVLFRTRLGQYEQDGHAHRLRLTGRVAPLQHPVLHDDRKPLQRWLTSQNKYGDQEADKLLSTPFAALGWPDRIRRLRVVAPWLVPTYYLFFRSGLRDGWAGINYAAQRSIAELVLTIKLIERAQGTANADARSATTPSHVKRSKSRRVSAD